MARHTLYDDAVAEKPVLTRAHALGAFGNLREALRSEGGEVADIDRAYSLLILAKDDLQAAVTACKKMREEVAAFRDQGQLEFALASDATLTISRGTRETAEAKA